MKTGFGRFIRMAKRVAAPAVMACMLSAAATGTAQAAQAEDVRKQGWEALPEDKEEAFREGIKQIPDEVVELHRLEEGCAWLVERKTKCSPSWEFGPGMPDPPAPRRTGYGYPGMGQ